MFTNVLVPTDGTEHSQRALEKAIGLAEAFDATVHVLSVGPEHGGETTQDQLRSDPDSEARRAVDEARERLTDAGVQSEGAVVDGEPHEEILRYTDEHDVDAIVMGTHGRTGVKHALFGSVAEKTVQNAHVPVMTVPPAEKESSLRNR